MLLFLYKNILFIVVQLLYVNIILYGEKGLTDVKN